MVFWSAYRPITFTLNTTYFRMSARTFESVTWLKHPRESNRPVLEPFLAEHRIFIMFTRQSDVRKQFGPANYKLHLLNFFIFGNSNKIWNKNRNERIGEGCSRADGSVPKFPKFRDTSILR